MFGHRGNLDFGVIDLPWLRTAAKRWVAEDELFAIGREAIANAVKHSASTAGSESPLSTLNLSSGAAIGPQ